MWDYKRRICSENESKHTHEIGAYRLSLLKPDHAVLFCTDVEGIVSNGKGSCCVRQFWGNQFPCVCVMIHLIDTVITYPVSRYAIDGNSVHNESLPVSIGKYVPRLTIA